MESRHSNRNALSRERWKCPAINLEASARYVFSLVLRSSQRSCCCVLSRVADPGGFYPDPDLTFEKKPGSNPNDQRKKNPDPDPEPCILRYGLSLLKTKLRKDFVQVCDSVEVVLIDPVFPGPHVGEVDHLELGVLSLVLVDEVV